MTYYDTDKEELKNHPT